MVEAGKASVYSVVLLLVFSIPVASQQVDIQESSEGFNAFVNTNFSSSFQMDIGTGLEEISLEDSDGSYSMTERPEKKTRKFVSPHGSLKVEKTPNMSVETVRTPYGVLKTGFREGENISSFSGPEDLKDRVREIREKLKSNLSVSRREASVKKSVVMEKMLPDVSLSHEFGDSESITISNDEEESISLDGWKVKNSDPDVYELKKTLSPGEEVVLYPKEAGNVTENAVESTGVDIDETEDSLTLENRLGREIDSETW
ncbi:hypothetical protein AQV86_00650 [Nanohaloarchaea archaeon SG9]|nr:hypothetical protein AQV86_00650 [Nanohaloarchaea archaeon SG9]